MQGLRAFTWLGAAVAVAALTLLAPLDGEAATVLAIAAFAMVIWISELVPLAITALGVSLLLILVGYQPTEVFAAYFDPVVVLLLGGFTMGVALSKHGLDVYLAAWVMQRAGARPALVLLALMVTTATLSMWISNTASTAVMLPIALGVLAANPQRTEQNLPRCMALGVAFSANIGGIATPIGTTANPIALRFLADAGQPVTFLGWMARAMPLVVLLILVLWLILLRVYPLSGEPLVMPERATRITRRQWSVMAVFGATVLLWLTTDLHGYSSSVVALVPILALFGGRLLDEPDISKLGWPTLLLIGGGLALGDAVAASGLDAAFAGGIRAVVGDSAGPLAFFVIAVAAVGLTLLASNTAAAVIMIPIVIQLATGWDVALPAMTMLAAAALSLDFMVPVGTPPNAMAYATGYVSVPQMLRAGVWVSLVGILLAAGFAYWLW